MSIYLFNKPFSISVHRSQIDSLILKFVFLLRFGFVSFGKGKLLLYSFLWFFILSISHVQYTCIHATVATHAHETSILSGCAIARNVGYTNPSSV